MMTDKEYELEKKRVKKFLDKWYSCLGLNWYHIEYEWDRNRNPDESSEVMKTEVSWTYREATIYIRLPACANQSDERLEHIIVHEFSHVLTGGFMANMDLSNDFCNQIMENATETVANALIWSREAGINDAKV